VRSIQNMVRVLSKYIQEKYISDRHKGIWSNGQHLLPSGAAHMFDHPSVRAGGRGRGVNWLCGGFQKRARQHRERQTSNPLVQRDADPIARDVGLDRHT
jgi:hypothetical protein